jgi:hypothetical protein
MNGGSVYWEQNGFEQDSTDEKSNKCGGFKKDN